MMYSVQSYNNEVSRKQIFHKRRKLWYTFLFFVCIFLIVVSIFTINTLTKKIDTTEQDLEVIFNTLHQIIDSNTTISNALELYPKFFELQLHSNKNQQTGLQTDTIELLIDEMYKSYQDELHKVVLADLLENSPLEKIITKIGLYFYQKNNQIIYLFDNMIVAIFTPLFDTDKNIITAFNIQSAFTNIKYVPLNFDELSIVIENIKETIDLNLELSQQFLQQLYKTLASDQLKQFIKSYNLSVNHAKAQYKHTTVIQNSINESIITMILDTLHYKLTVNEIPYSKSPKPLKRISYVIDTILNSSYITKQETANLNYLSILKTILFSKNIQDTLQQQNFYILENWRTDNDYYYFDVNTNVKHPYPQSKIGAIALQRSNGQLWMMDKDDIPIRSVSFSIEQETSSQNSVISGETKNILIVGTHNNLADTLMLVHIHPKKGIKLLSIPRDIYFMGNKLNWYYKFYTQLNFLKIMENVTGLKIDSYIGIDMYAFISVIDKIGGITIYLEEDLIDPSYRIKKNGKWSYIHYTQGEYQLNGIEALRIARSRNTTNDFSRSRRQQLILESIRNKINNMDIFSSTLSLIQIVGDIKPYIETNLSIFEIASMITKNKNTPLNKKFTLSISNILYQTYTNLFLQKTSKDSMPSKEDTTINNYGSYILLPKNNDWKAFRLFIKNYILE